MLVHSLDPRIKRIKQEEKAARDAKKKGKGQSTPGKKSKAEEEAEKKRAEEEAKQKEEAEKVCSSCVCHSDISHGIRCRLLGQRPRKQKLQPQMLRKRREDCKELQKTRHDASFRVDVVPLNTVCTLDRISLLRCRDACLAILFMIGNNKRHVGVQKNH